jgi:hypothetical protein
MIIDLLPDEPARCADCRFKPAVLTINVKRTEVIPAGKEIPYCRECGVKTIIAVFDAARERECS